MTIVDSIASSAKELGNTLEIREGRVDVSDNAQLSSALHAAAERVATAINKLGKPDGDSEKRTARLANARLEVLRRLGDPNDADVVWIEKVGRTRRIKVAPVFVGPALGGMLLDARPVVAVSATLGGEPPFAGLAAQMGFDSAAAPGTWGERNDDGTRNSATGRGYVPLQAASSFDWRQQGLLYAGHDLPDPRRANETWVKKAGDRLCKLVNAAGGRSLVLCTSKANVERFADLLRERTDHDVLAQGDADVAKLTRSFIEDETSVLVGTRSFWAGIDVPGVACLLVVIDRIPFPPLSDPLHAARRTRRSRGTQRVRHRRPAGGRARARAGRGPVDPHQERLGCGRGARLPARDASYRTELLTAMPPFRRSIDLDETCDFLKEAAKRVPKSRASQPTSAAPRPSPRPKCSPALAQGAHQDPQRGELPRVRRRARCALSRRERLDDGLPARRAHQRGARRLSYPPSRRGAGRRPAATTHVGEDGEDTFRWRRRTRRHLVGAGGHAGTLPSTLRRGAHGKLLGHDER